MDIDGEDAVFSYPEWQANTFAVDCTGRRAVLAVQKWLAVVGLSGTGADENGGSPKALRKLAKQNKYEIKTVQWNPHPTQVDLLASTSQQKLEVWNVNAERHPLLHSIKAHTRPVSDLSWSFADPHLLASCAVDSFVHIWDVREARRPKASFRAVAGASLVQWNRLNGNILASAHDSDIRIWDMRKTTTASGYITAHMTRIHDLDWSHHSAKQLTTCSHDASIKFWDISSPREPLSTIKAGSQPLWRARNYPVGHAVAMALVPAMHGGDSRVFLWGRSNVSAPLHTFVGHTEPVLEVQWRRFKGDFQLVTWSKDHTLRVWSIAEDLKENLGVDPGDQSLVDDSSLSLNLTEISFSTEAEAEQSITSLTRSEELSHSHVSERSMTPTGTSPTKSFTPSSVSVPSVQKEPPGSSPQVFQSLVAHTLAQEFSLLNHVNIPNLFMERMESSQRSCTVRVEHGDHLVRVGITFPSHYPNGAAPSFIFDKSTTIDIGSQQQLNSIITETAISCVKQNRPCLEQCLRRLAKSLETFVSRPQPPPKQPPGFDIAFGHLDDEHIPFPRTSGGRFCANGYLVCFHLPPGLVLPTDVKQTPRSMDKLNFYRSHIRPVTRASAWRTGYLSSSLPKRGSAQNLLQVPGPGGREKSGGSIFTGDKGDTENPYTGKLTIHDITPMLPIDYSLAKLYSLTGSSPWQLCEVNARVAATHGRADLVQAWSTAALIADERIKMPPDPDSGMPWSRHPFGRSLIHSLFNHFENLHDVQTLAMLACVFQTHSSNAIETVSIIPRNPSWGSTSSNNHSMHPKKTTGGSRSPVLSSSWHDVEGDFPAGPEDEQTSHDMNCRLLDDLFTCKCDEYRRCYANILYRWDLLPQRAEVLKFQVTRREGQMKIGFSSLCRKCGELVTGPSCKKSKCFAFTCSICNLAVRGSSNFCLSCGHGGHARHMLEWFEKYPVCPAGCGCKCLEASGWTW